MKLALLGFSSLCILNLAAQPAWAWSKSYHHNNAVYTSHNYYAPPPQVMHVQQTTSVRCTNSNNPLGMLLGGAAGGIVGNSIGKGKGKTAAVITGAVLGSAIGGASAGRECYEEVYAQPVVTPVAWQTTSAPSYYAMTPQDYNTQGRYCREYQSVATVGGRTSQTYGTACMQPDGSWEIVD